MCKINTFGKLIVLLLFSLLIQSCDEGVDTIIPDVPVNVSINTSRTPYLLLGNGGSMILPNNPFQAGYAGIVIYRASAYEYYAFDRCCPHHVEEVHRVNLDGALAICPVDSSEFMLADGLGLPIRGPSKYGLKHYRTSTSTQSDGIWLRIYN